EKHAPTVYDEYVTTEDSVGGWDTAKNLLAAMGRTTKDAFNATADFLDGDDGRERKQDEAQIRRLAAKENKSTGGETSSRSLTQEEKLRNILKKIE
ncbi:MAG: hypothetical protein CMI52_02615, partial [Parcubacteria group bacterium]|nr:hypothetical protein [Parcubacteria group bacterium]